MNIALIFEEAISHQTDGGVSRTLKVKSNFIGTPTLMRKNTFFGGGVTDFSLHRWSSQNIALPSANLKRKRLHRVTPQEPHGKKWQFQFSRSVEEVKSWSYSWTVLLM